MGEVRFEYDAALIGQMRASGLDAITITLCDPKVYEGQAYEEAIQAVLDHDAHIAKHPELFLKATSTSDIDVAWFAHGIIRSRGCSHRAAFFLFFRISVTSEGHKT